MLNIPNCLFSHLIFALFCPLLVNSNYTPYQFPMQMPGGSPTFQIPMAGGLMMPPVAANAAEIAKPGSMQNILDHLNPTTHGTNHVDNFQRKKRPQEEIPLPEPPLLKVILVIWDQNGEILDDPHVQLRAVQEEHAVMQAGMLPLAHMSPLIECAHDLKENPHEICDYDLLIGSGVVDITLRKDRRTGKNRVGYIEISYAEKENGARISYIEIIERLAIASDPGHKQHQEHHQKDMTVKTNDVEYRKILHLKYHPFESYAYVYHIYGIVFWRGNDFSKIDPMPITAPDPFVHMEYFSDHEHVMNKLPYEMDLNAQTGEFRITIRNGYGLDKQREAEDKNYGKINIAVAVNKTLFRMRYYRVYTINVNECIKKSQHFENGTQHQTYSKENPAQILYLWGDKEKMRFGQFPLKVNTHAFRIQIVRNGQVGCEKPFAQYIQPQNWLELRDEDDEMTLIHATNVQSVDQNTLLLHITLQPNIAEGLHIRIDCGADASIHNVIIYQLESFEQLRSNQMEVQLKPAISTSTISQNDYAPHVTIASEQHNVHQAARNPHSKMEHKRKHNGIDQIDAVLAEDENGGGKPIRDDRCAPGLARGRLAKECNSHLHRNGYDRLPENVAHLGHGGGPNMPQIGQTFSQFPGSQMGNMAPQMDPYAGHYMASPQGQQNAAGHFGAHPPAGQLTSSQLFGKSDQDGKAGMQSQLPMNQLHPAEKQVDNSNLPPNRAAPADGSLLHNPPLNKGHNQLVPEQNGQRSSAGEYPSALEPSMAYLHAQPQPPFHQNPLGMMNGSQQYPQMLSAGEGMPLPPDMMNGAGGHPNAGMPGNNPHEMSHHAGAHGTKHPSNMQPPTMHHHQQNSSQSTNHAAAGQHPNHHPQHPDLPHHQQHPTKQ